MNPYLPSRPPIVAFVWADENIPGLDEMFAPRKPAARVGYSAFVAARPRRRTPAGPR